MFRVPADHDRLTIVEAGAGRFVERPQVRGKFDVVQIDLYDAQARGPVEDSIAFYENCRAALKTVGIGVVNLFGEHDSYGRNLRRLREVFHGRVLALPQIEAANRVALVFQGPEIHVPFAQLYARVRDIESSLGLASKRWVDGLKKAAVEAGSDRRDGCLHI
jgi:spermidine synthase